MKFHCPYCLYDDLHESGWLPVITSFVILAACFALLGYVIYGDF